jgi:hypothetical protein
VEGSGDLMATAASYANGRQPAGRRTGMVSTGTPAIRVLRDAGTVNHVKWMHSRCKVCPNRQEYSF